MREWIETHGTDALKRASAEGYNVSKGVGDFLISQVGESLDMDLIMSWKSVEERTSPTASAFAKRDLVQACVKTLDVPPGWVVEVSRISRVTLGDDKKFTGVMVVVRDDFRAITRQAAVNFESA